MKNGFKCLIFAMSTVPLLLQGATVQHAKFRGDMATWDVSWYDYETCGSDSSFTQISIIAFTVKEQATSQPAAHIFAQKYDACRRVYTEAFGDADPSALTFLAKGRLDETWVNATFKGVVTRSNIDTWDVISSGEDVVVSLVWKGSGEISKETQRFLFHPSSCTSLSQTSSGLSRNAEASGSIRIGAEELIRGIPPTNPLGSLMDSQNSTITWAKKCGP